jgi:SnoaL-like domain
MNTEKVVTDLLAAWEMHDLTKTVGLLADNFKLTGPAPKPLNKEAFLMFQRVHNEAFPDWKFNVSDLEAVDNEVYVTIRIRATHLGVYDVSKLGLSIPPIQPTGKSRSWPVEYLTCTVKNNKITHIEVTNGPDGGLMGTLAWLGVELPAAAM